MKLERYKDKKETRRKVILIGLTVITLVSITMVLYKTFAKFTTTASFPIMSGKVVYKKKGPNVGGIVIPVVEEGEGMYEVIPAGPSEEWLQSEYRYAGKNPNNYVSFNNELWRIIGLVNVKTSSGVEQRIKIIRNDSLGEYPWDRVFESNEWFKASLMEMLNDGYYNASSSANCWTIYDTVQKCDFSNGNTKGLDQTARNMIDKNVIWNIGACYYADKAEEMYTCERSVDTYPSRPEYSYWTSDIIWRASNSQRAPELLNGIAIIYPSDYGYAVGGENRSKCLATSLGAYKSGGCYQDNWLNIPYSSQWTLTKNTTNTMGLSFILWYLSFDLSKDYTPIQSLKVKPSLYLRSDVKITGGSGTSEKPYTLALT